MRYVNLFIVLSILFISCKNKNESSIKENYNESASDTIKEYYDDEQKTLKLLKLKNGRIITFFKNGRIFSEGNLNSEQNRIGVWNFYTNEGLLSESREYRIINKKPYINQIIYFDEDENKLYNRIESFNYYSQIEFQRENLEGGKSHYAEFDFGKDTINLNEPWRAACFYYTPLFRDNNSEMIIVLNKEESLFNEDFSNIKEVKKDTFFSLSRDVENQKWFPEDDPDYTVVFGRWFDSPGEKTIRGFLSEFYEKTKKDTTILVESKMFFEKVIYVKDTVH